MATRIWVKIAAGNGLLPVRTKPLHEPVWLTIDGVLYHSPGGNFSGSDKHINRSLHWRHNDHDGVSNHQPHGCLLNRLFRRRSKKTSKLRVTGLCVGNSPGPVNSPHKGPVTRKMFPFDDVIMWWMRNYMSLFMRMQLLIHALNSAIP